VTSWCCLTQSEVRLATTKRSLSPCCHKLLQYTDNKGDAALESVGGLMSETLREAILAFDSTTAIVLFTPAMVAIAVWHEVRERRRRRGW
jgi:hypothetical protein